MKEYVSKPNFVNPVFSGKQTDAGRKIPTRINHTYKKLIFLPHFYQDTPFTITLNVKFSTTTR